VEPPPKLDPDLLWVWSAWEELRSERQWIGGGMAPLMPGNTPWHIVMAWADRRGLDDVAARFLLEGISILDAEFLTAHQRKHKETVS
jgi:hypothetical protein